MKKICLILTIFFFHALHAYKYDLAICAITRDDGPYLKEWVEFHIHQGVQRFFIYDNLSEEPAEKFLQEYIKMGVVEVIKWDVEHETRAEWLSCQCNAYMNCVNLQRKTIKWCAFIDTDEFLFCPSGMKLTQFLKDFKGYHQIAVNWKIFGTSNVQKAAAGNLIQELLFTGETQGHENCKCIVRLDKALGCSNPHIFFIKNKSLLVNPDKQTVTASDFAKKPPRMNKIRINHYMFRDLDFFHHKKLARLLQQVRPIDAMIKLESNFNSVYDDSILRCLPKKQTPKNNLKITS